MSSFSLTWLSTAHSSRCNKGDHVAAVDGGVEPPIPELVEDSSDNEDDGEAPGGGDDQWGPEDDAVEKQHVEQPAPAPAGPRQSNREKRGIPSLCFIEECLDAAVEQEVKKSPQSVLVAMQGPHSEKWKRAMESEMDSLKENGVYEIVDRPAGKKVVKSKWVFRVKTNELGEVEKYKARVVAKGFSQVEGVDYDQTFSPTVRFESIRQLVAMGASKGMNVHQLNVTTTFLYAPLEEVVFMEQPEGTVKEGDEGKVMRLLKCLYGLKQSPRQWNICIDTALKQLGFVRLKSDVGIYVKGEGGEAVYIALYVDELVHGGNEADQHRGGEGGVGEGIQNEGSG